MPKIKHNDYSALRASGRTTGSRPPDDGAALGFGAIGTTSLEQMSPTDREILLAAMIVVELYGSNAVRHALARAGIAQRRQAADAQCMWGRIARRVVDLQRDRRRAGEAVN